MKLKLNKTFSSVLIGSALLIQSSMTFAKEFKIGDQVFAAFEAGNIKDDAFMIGSVKRIMSNGDYLLDVQDYVVGHDYSSSCVPISKHEDPQATAEGYAKGWELIDDKSQLSVEDYDYVVPAANLMTVNQGKHYFVERNNLYFVFGRWKSDAPVLTEDRIVRAQREAKTANLDDMLSALELMRLHRISFYSEQNRPLYPFERIQPLNTMMAFAIKVLEEDKNLKMLWSARPRDWEIISKSTKYYFLIDAIDKALSDSKTQIYETGVEEAGKSLDELIEKIAYLDKLRPKK